MTVAAESAVFVSSLFLESEKLLVLVFVLLNFWEISFAFNCGDFNNISSNREQANGQDNLQASALSIYSSNLP